MSARVPCSDIISYYDRLDSAAQADALVALSAACPGSLDFILRHVSEHPEVLGDIDRNLAINVINGWPCPGSFDGLKLTPIACKIKDYKTVEEGLKALGPKALDYYYELIRGDVLDLNYRDLAEAAAYVAYETGDTRYVEEAVKLGLLPREALDLAAGRASPGDAARIAEKIPGGAALYALWLVHRFAGPAAEKPPELIEKLREFTDYINRRDYVKAARLLSDRDLERLVSNYLGEDTVRAVRDYAVLQEAGVLGDYEALASGRLSWRHLKSLAAAAEANANVRRALEDLGVGAGALIDFYRRAVRSGLPDSVIEKILANLDKLNREVEEYNKRLRAGDLSGAMAILESDPLLVSYARLVDPDAADRIEALYNLAVTGAGAIIVALGKTGSWAEKATLYGKLARLAERDSRVRDALKKLMDIGVGDLYASEAAAYYNAAVEAFKRGDYAEARTWASKAVEVARRAARGDLERAALSVMARALYNLAAADARMHNFQEALQLLREAYEKARKAGDMEAAVDAQQAIFNVYMAMAYEAWRGGRIGDAESIARRALSVAREARNPMMEREVYSFLASIFYEAGVDAFKKGDKSRALAYLDKAVMYARRAGLEDIARAGEEMAEAIRYLDEIERMDLETAKCIAGVS